MVVWIASTSVLELVVLPNKLERTVSFRKKRQWLLALFFVLALPAHAELCPAKGEVATARVAKVVDGDTVEFVDGRKVRLIGVNTPELDHGNGQHQPYALQATQYLRQRVEGKSIYYQAGLDRLDRYGRYLLYLFDEDRISLSSRLISEGLGYRIAIPPNLSYQDCLVQAELAARKQGKGLWHLPVPWQPKAGFQHVRITITSITHNRAGWWLDTNQNLVIHLPEYAAEFWSVKDIYKLEGHQAEARGWQYSRKQRRTGLDTWVLLIKHPNDLRDMT